MITGIPTTAKMSNLLLRFISVCRVTSKEKEKRKSQVIIYNGCCSALNISVIAKEFGLTLGQVHGRL
jgi:hypothetical protein